MYISKQFFFQTISYGIIFNRKGGGRVAIGAIKKRGIDGVKCPSPFPTDGIFPAKRNL